MKRWYVVHTLPKQEEIAFQNLQNQKFEAFLPRFHRTRRHARKVDVVIAPLFPRYLFVAFDIEKDRFLTINSTRGVQYLLRQEGMPAVVPVGVVESLQESADIEDLVPLSSLELFTKGAKLEVLSGPLQGYTGVFEKMSDADRVELLLTMMGRNVKVAVPLHTVVEVA